MNRISRRHACRFLVIAALAGTSLAASAADRRFVPVPATDYQKLQVINGATIISAAGKGFHAGASLAATSGRLAVLSVSVKNTSVVPVPFNDAGIVVRHGDNILDMKSAEQVPDQPKDAKDMAAANADLAPGALVVRQFLLELPKRSKTIPLKLKLSVTVQGETIEFDFNELN
ncbi:MAG: hypothetical protein NT117_02565 [Gammaproteobacteria bacterium]|nr:hypothetical protein [Gammaproteobacteria bacterium]